MKILDLVVILAGTTLCASGARTTTDLKAPNRVQQWTAQFDAQGMSIAPDRAEWSWGLELRSYGFSGSPVLAQSAAPAAQGNTFRYERGGGMQEWFVNDGSLEQGFTLKSRPAGTGELRIDMAVRGGLKPHLKDSFIAFVDAGGNPLLRYGALKAWDSNGKILPTRFALAGDLVRLIVDERGASYPITIDPVILRASLQASNTDSGDRFGAAVALSGNTLVVGAPYEASNATGVNGNQADNSAPDTGAAYVFVSVGGVWTQQAYLKPSSTGGNFGWSVAISGDTVAIGAPNQVGTGAVYVFTRSGSTWTQQALLKASNADPGDAFGTAVGLSGDTLVAGAPNEASNARGSNGNQADNSSPGSGAAYVFSRLGVQWYQRAYLKASNADPGDWFGYSVAASGGTIVVGAPYESSSAITVNGDQSDNSVPEKGAAYVFVGQAWTQQAYLKAPAHGGFYGPGNEELGFAVAISGDVIIASAPFESNIIDSFSNSGAAYSFRRSGVTWTLEPIEYLPPYAQGIGFGLNVAISGDTKVIGASGTTYVFSPTRGNWTLPDYAAAVAVSGDIVALGQPGYPNSYDPYGHVNIYGVSAGQTNTPPTINATGATLAAGSQITTPFGYVNDAEDPPTALKVVVQSANPMNGVRISGIDFTYGTVSAQITAACNATSASFLLRVTDTRGASATATLDVTVIPGCK